MPYLLSAAPETKQQRQSIVSILKNKALSEQNALLQHPLIEKNFKIYSKSDNILSDIGDKAGELLLKTPAIAEAGFELNPRAVIGASILEDFIKQFGLFGDMCYSGSRWFVEELVLKTAFSKEYKKMMAEICVLFKDYKFLAVRSSAYGDARGTGTYDSFYCKNTFGQVEFMVKNVLLSHFTEKARQFRKDTRSPPGIAVMIEPVVIDTWHDSDNPSKKYYAPVLSGFGTNGIIRSDNILRKVNLVPGLASDLMFNTQLGLSLSDSPWASDFDNTLDNVRKNDWNKYGGTALFGNKQALDKEGNLVSTDMENLPYHKLLFENDDNWEKIKGMKSLFDKMVALENACGKPQYFEWAMVEKEGKQQYFITQIADAPNNRYDFTYDEVSPLLIAKTRFPPYGAGKKEFDTVIVTSTLDEKVLAEINSKYKNHLLIFQPRSLFIYSHGIKAELLSNAAAFAVYGPEARGLRYVADGHTGGVLTTSGKLLVEFDPLDKPCLDLGKIHLRAASREAIMWQVSSTSPFSRADSAYEKQVATVYRGVPLVLRASEYHGIAILEFRE